MQKRYVTHKVGTFWEVFDTNIKQTMHVTENWGRHVTAMSYFNMGRGEEFIRDNHTV